MLENTYTLENGIKIPKLGLGTWFIDDSKVAEAVREAVKIGYRMIDTAQAYGNERGVGEGSAPVESREKTYLLCQKLQQSTRHMSRQWRESMKP